MKKIIIVGDNAIDMLARAMRQNPPSEALFFARNPEPIALKPDGEAFCIGCGCTDGHACVHSVTGPCWWIKVDRKLGIGVCSECEEKVETFETMALVMHEKISQPGRR
jgi:hypothetical protein